MPYQVQAIRPDPILDYVVADASTGAPRRLTVLAGVVAVAPTEQRTFEMSGFLVPQPSGEPVGFYLPDCDALPVDEDVSLTAEAALTQVVVFGNLQGQRAYGIGDVAGRLVPDNLNQARLPYLGFTCYGLYPLGVRYRVTLYRDGSPRS
jgi:hypothetical protein